jgi:hypothetical protein
MLDRSTDIDKPVRNGLIYTRNTVDTRAELIDKDDRIMKYNGREQGDQKRHVFVCKLTDGRLAALPQGNYDAPDIFDDMAELKSRIMLTVPDIRIPVYEKHELVGLKTELDAR